MVALLAFLQFSIVLDFMIISPLGAIIMPDLGISPQRFGERLIALKLTPCCGTLLVSKPADSSTGASPARSYSQPVAWIAIIAPARAREGLDELGAVVLPAAALHEQP